MAESVTKAESRDHHGSHRDLLWTPDAAWSHVARVDAIVVPTTRGPAVLEHAADIAVQLDCPLVTLHSGKWTNALAAARRLSATKVDLIAIDVPDPAHLRLPAFETEGMLAGTRFARRTDTSAKRNLSLMLCHMVGWERIVFLDDDINVNSCDDLTRAVGLLDAYNAVGLSIGGFPDNSVVCHAYRRVGGPQESFIGGGALAVGLARNRSCFPNIYNEDWFYLFDAEKGLQPLAVTGKVIQSQYDPFRTPDRARAEEFGDVLAEGTFWLLDQGRSVCDADERHWTEYLARRARFIEHVLDRVAAEPINPGEKSRMTEALRAARVRLDLITPSLCQNYLRAWAADRARWRCHVDRLAIGQTMESAVGSLAADGHRRLTWYSHGQLRSSLAGSAMVRRRPAAPAPATPAAGPVVSAPAVGRAAAR
jgi:hypothetical protein